MSKSIENIETKSLNPAGLEDKAVAAPAPVSDGLVSVVVAHPLPAGVISEQKQKPGDELRVSAYVAKTLAEQGLVRPV